MSVKIRKAKVRQMSAKEVKALLAELKEGGNAAQARDREVFDVLRVIKGQTPSEVSRKCAERALAMNDRTVYVSPGTVTKWRQRLEDGGTRWPRNRTMDAVLRAYGKRRVIVDNND